MMHYIVTFLFLFDFVHISSQDKPYNFRPESRHVDVNEGDDYYVGFDQIDNKTVFGHCYIYSDIFNIDYVITPRDDVDIKNSNHVESDASSGFNPFNGTGVCGFIYYTDVDANVPQKWIITAYDYKTSSNFTEEVTITYYYNMSPYLDRMTALQGASVINFFQVDTIKLKKCSIGFDNVTVDLDLNAVKVYNDSNLFKSRLISLGEGICGYKINNLVLSDSRDLTLYGTDDGNKNYRALSHLAVIEVSILKNRTLKVYLGDTATVICGKETDGSANSDQKFCHLYSPNGILVSHGHMCDYDLHIVTKDDLGTWKCYVGYDYTMETLEFTTVLVEKKSESVSTFSNNTANYYIIGCQLVDFKIYTLDYCKFTRPDGKIFKVYKGGASANYTSFTSDLENGRCALELLKPLRNEDKGSWKCEAVFYEDESSGAFINVETTTTFPYDKNTKKNVRIGNSFVIDCMVPYASDHCYIIAPNGTQYNPEGRLQITSGICLFKVDVSVASDNGTWKCFIAQSNGVPDEIITVDISIIDLKVIYGDVEAVQNGQVDLICNTNGVPIEYCRFESPLGLSYSLRKENSEQRRISYTGHGLEYGDCGLRISIVDLNDNGKWTCHISSGRYNYKNKSDLTKDIQLKVVLPKSPVSVVNENRDRETTQSPNNCENYFQLLTSPKHLRQAGNLKTESIYVNV